jgi:hypothetical protein
MLESQLAMNDCERLQLWICTYKIWKDLPSILKNVVSGQITIVLYITKVSKVKLRVPYENMSQENAIATVDEKYNVKLSAGNTADDKSDSSIIKGQEDMDMEQDYRYSILQRIRSGRVNRRKRGYVRASE